MITADSRKGLPETERTAPTAALCAICGTPMPGRRPQARFCSDACRARGGRQAQRERLAALMDAITRATNALRRELDLLSLDCESTSVKDIADDRRRDEGQP